MREHGTYVKYVQDKCRCPECQAARRAYNEKRAAETAPPYVGADRARQHLRYLAENGVGLKQVVKVAPVSQGALWKLMYGKRQADGTQVPSKRIKPETEAAILAVEIHDAAPGSREPAAKTLANVETLLARGWTKVAIGKRVHGPTARTLQLGDQEVTRHHARTIAALLHEPVPARVSRWGVHEVEQPEESEPEIERQAVDLYDTMRIPAGLDQSWKQRATCRRPEYPTRLFFPARGDTKTIAKAREACARCPVAVECRVFAEAIGATGVWGGTSEKQRKRTERAA